MWQAVNRPNSVYSAARSSVRTPTEPALPSPTSTASTTSEGMGSSGALFGGARRDDIGLAPSGVLQARSSAAGATPTAPAPAPAAAAPVAALAPSAMAAAAGSTPTVSPGVATALALGVGIRPMRMPAVGLHPAPSGGGSSHTKDLGDPTPDGGSGGFQPRPPIIHELDVINGIQGAAPNYTYAANGVPVGEVMSFEVESPGGDFATISWSGGSNYASYFRCPRAQRPRGRLCRSAQTLTHRANTTTLSLAPPSRRITCR